ncbi:unnamed protein product, partial [Rotaria sp. Silwood1]
MAGTYDTEEQRIIDRIKCIAFREALDAGTTFINRHWAKSIDDIEEDECYREMVKNQACIGIFVIFTAKRLHWVIKDKRESWTGQYFRDIILTENVFSFLKNEENVIDPDEVIFVHDKAP